MAKAPKTDLPEDNKTSENTADNAQNSPEGGNGVSLNTPPAGESGATSSGGDTDDKPTDDHQEQWASVRVVNSPYPTRRRAGFEFTREAKLVDLASLPIEMQRALACDPCLEIKLAEAESISSEDA